MVYIIYKTTEETRFEQEQSIIRQRNNKIVIKI